MRGYVVHHKTDLYDGVRADRFHNDPWVSTQPYLWSFCHLNQRPRVEKGMTIIWVSKVNGQYLCDLVFVVERIVQFKKGRRRFGVSPTIRRLHFNEGIANHPEALLPRPGATLLASVGHTFRTRQSLSNMRSIRSGDQRTPVRSPFKLRFGGHRRHYESRT